MKRISRLPIVRDTAFPTMDQGAIGWLSRYVRSNFWRVYHWYDVDDLMQDGYMIYWHISNRYSYVSERRHLMSLFQRSFTNHVTMIAKKRSVQSIEQCMSDILEPDVPPDNLYNGLPDPECGTFQVLCAQASPPIRATLQLFDSQRGLHNLRQRYRVRRDGTRETLSDRFARLIGYAPPRDPLWFWGEPGNISIMLQTHFGT